MWGLSVQREIGENTANQSAEFEAMAGESCTEDDMRMLWMFVNEEMLIRRHGVETNHRRG